MQIVNTTVSFPCILFDIQKFCLFQIPTVHQLPQQEVSENVGYCRIANARLCYMLRLHLLEEEQYLQECKK